MWKAARKQCWVKVAQRGSQDMGSDGSAAAVESADRHGSMRYTLPALRGRSHTRAAVMMGSNTSGTTSQAFMTSRGLGTELMSASKGQGSLLAILLAARDLWGHWSRHSIMASNFWNLPFTAMASRSSSTTNLTCTACCQPRCRHCSCLDIAARLAGINKRTAGMTACLQNSHQPGCKQQGRASPLKLEACMPHVCTGARTTAGPGWPAARTAPA